MNARDGVPTENIPEYRRVIQAFWEAFCTHANISPTVGYLPMRFGDTEEMANSLYRLVDAGTKRAGSSLLWEYDATPELLPRVGDYWVVADFAKHPQLIVQVVNVVITSYDQIDAQFAAAEGGGDLSLEYWQAVHWDFFGRRCMALDKTRAPDMPVVCMHFACVYPR